MNKTQVITTVISALLGGGLIVGLVKECNNRQAQSDLRFEKLLERSDKKYEECQKESAQYRKSMSEAVNDANSYLKEIGIMQIKLNDCESKNNKLLKKIYKQQDAILQLHKDTIQ